VTFGQRCAPRVISRFASRRLNFHERNIARCEIPVALAPIKIVGRGQEGWKKGSAKSYRGIAAIVGSDSTRSTFRIQLARVTSLGGEGGRALNSKSAFQRERKRRSFECRPATRLQCSSRLSHLRLISVHTCTLQLINRDK